MSSKDDDENENEGHYETMSQNEKNETIKYLNDLLDEMIGKSKSFEEQIKLLKKREDLKGFCRYHDFGDKELKSKYFKKELADMSNEIDEKLFKQIFGYTLETLANKPMHTTNKEENQIIVKNINKKNKDKIDEMDPFNNFVIQSDNLHADLKYNIDLILNFNEEIQLDLV